MLVRAERNGEGQPVLPPQTISPPRFVINVRAAQLTAGLRRSEMVRRHQNLMGSGQLRLRARWIGDRLKQRRRISWLRKQGVRISRSVEITPNTTIGRGTIVNQNCVFKGRGSIEVGKFCEIGEGVHVISDNHVIRRANLNVQVQWAFATTPPIEVKGPIHLGHNVWIGDNAILLSGVKIGNGAVVGAGAVVAKDVKPFTIVAGCPARPIRHRFSDDVVRELEALAWWHWSAEKMGATGTLFDKDLTADDAVEFLQAIGECERPGPRTPKVH